MSDPLILEAPPETGVTFPPERLDEEAEEIERLLIAVLLLFIIGKLSKALTRKRGMAIIDKHFKAIFAEVNAHYKKQGLATPTLKTKAIKDVKTLIVAEFEKMLSAEDYWKTEKGVRQSTMMLAMLITYAVAAAVAVSVARKIPDAVLVWMTKEDPDVCIICEGFKGEYDPHDPNLPIIPPHPNGRCWWIIIFGEG